jgi:hypothetical protein
MSEEELPLSDRTLQLADRVIAREAPATELTTLLEQLVQAAREGREQFLRDSDGSPELTADEREQVCQTMDDYLVALEELQSRASAGQVEGAGEALQRARNALATVRDYRERYVYACTHGPAVHPFLNRLVAHLDVMAERETDKRHTLALLELLGGFLEEVGEQVGGIDEPTMQEKAQAALRTIEEQCGSLRAALESGQGDPELYKSLRATLVESSDVVAEGLGMQFERDLSVGRTPYPPVNLVLAACDRLLTGQISHEFFREAVEQALWLTRFRFPEETQDSVADASREVRESLERLWNMPARPDPEELVAEREVLRSATENLSMFVAVLQSEDEVLDLVQHEGLAGGGGGVGRGLPGMLSGLLQLGDQFLEGQAGKEDLDEAIKALEQTISRTRSQMATSRESAERAKLLEDTVAHLTRAAEAMRDLLERKGGRGALERAEHEMVASQEAMKNLETTR